jgi:hypothetical protein
LDLSINFFHKKMNLDLASLMLVDLHVFVDQATYRHAYNFFHKRLNLDLASLILTSGIGAVNMRANALGASLAVVRHADGNHFLPL